MLSTKKLQFDINVFSAPSINRHTYLQKAGFFNAMQQCTQWARKSKKVQAKKFVKSNKSISPIFFDQIPFLAISKMAKNQFLIGEKFKTARNAISRKKLTSRVFLPGLF